MLVRSLNQKQLLLQAEQMLQQMMPHWYIFCRIVVHHTHTHRNGCIGPVYIAGIGAMYQSHGLNAPTVKSTMLQRSACGLKQAAHSAAVVVYAD